MTVLTSVTDCVVVVIQLLVEANVVFFVEEEVENEINNFVFVSVFPKLVAENETVVANRIAFFVLEDESGDEFNTGTVTS